MRLEGKRVLITGASSGIGYAAAKLMAEEGADIAFTYCQNRTNAMKLQEEIEQDRPQGYLQPNGYDRR